MVLKNKALIYWHGLCSVVCKNVMFQNFLTIAWRNLLRYKQYTLINILGLSIGIACCLMILLYVQNEVNYDNFHEKGNRIYRMALERLYPGRSTRYATIPQSYAEAIVNDFPEVEAATRLFGFEGSILVKIDDQVYEENSRIWADSNFFNIFTIPLLQGNPDEVLVKPNTVVLTATTAKKYFGQENPVGKVLDIPQNDNDLLVTGVCADVPSNSHFTFDLVMSSRSLAFLNQPNFIGFSSYTYLLLESGASPEAVEAKFPDLVVKYASGAVARNFGVSYEEYVKNGNGYNYFLQPLRDIYLRSNLEAELKAPGSLTRVYIFTIIAVFILFIACINFMNLATARSTERSREVGIRKTLGSEKRSIAFQFLLEAIMISYISTALALGILWFSIPAFNLIAGKSIQISQILTWLYFPIILVFPIVIGLVAGVYPAIVLSGFQPLEVLKGGLLSTKKGAWLRNGLVVVQFAISVVLIISTLIVFKQLKFIQNKELGFDKENILSIQGGFNLDPAKTESFKNQLRQIAGVEAVGTCSVMPGGSAYFGVSFKPPGDNEMVTGRGLIIDEDYIECMKMEILDGRDYAKEFTADTQSVMINEAAMKELGLTDPVGKKLTTNDNFNGTNAEGPYEYTIIGVVKDFHFQSLHQGITPLFFINSGLNQGVNGFFSVRVNAPNIQQTIRQIESAWVANVPEVPFKFSFLDQDLGRLYVAEQTSQRVFSLFSLLAIFIACMGLLGLAAYITQRRTKEIGIRKILGATTGGIVGYLLKDFIKLVFIALLIASPLAWYTMNQWLQDFAYRINIEWWMFLLAGLVAVLVAFLTVGFQSLKAALANPVESLRQE